MRKEDASDISDIIGGTLNIFGLKIDLAKLLSSPEEASERLEELREKLKKAGGKEVLSDEAWKRGEATVSGYFRTSGILGEREYHIGTAAPKAGRKKEGRPPPRQEAIEPVVDVFYEADEIIVVAEVPGIELADVELKIKDNVLSLTAKPTAGRNYRKKIELSTPVDESSLKATCRNGIMEVHLKKKIEPHGD